MPKATTLFLAAAAFLFVLPPVQAQSSFHHVELFAEGGASFTNETTAVVGTVQLLGPPPAGDVTVTNASLRTTGRVFAGARFFLDSRDAIEASISYSPSDLLLRSVCNPNCGGTRTAVESLRAFLLAANYVRVFRSAARIEPFITLGAGLVAFDQVQTLRLGHDPFATNLGGGFDFRLSHRWALRAEYRDWIFEMPRESQATATGLTHNSVPSAGIVYRF